MADVVKNRRYGGQMQFLSNISEIKKQKYNGCIISRINCKQKYLVSESGSLESSSIIFFQHVVEYDGFIVFLGSHKETEI